MHLCPRITTNRLGLKDTLVHSHLVTVPLAQIGVCHCERVATDNACSGGPNGHRDIPSMAVQQCDVRLIVLSNDLELLIDPRLGEHPGTMTQIAHVLDGEQTFLNHRVDQFQKVRVLHDFVSWGNDAEASTGVIADYGNPLVPLRRLVVGASKE